MRIVDVTLVYDESLRTEEKQLKQHYTSVGWAEALQRKGVEVFSLRRFYRENSFKKNGVQYYFIKDKFGPALTNKQFPMLLIKKIVSLKPDLVHLHNLSHSMQTLFLRFLLKKNIAIVLQHHGGPFPAKGAKKKFHDIFNSVADGYFFTTVEHGKQWFPNKRFHGKIMPIMEGAPIFNYETMDWDRKFEYQNRHDARKKTNMTGNPLFLWSGRLDDNKDPLTVLAGFESLCSQHPEAVLYMIYSDEKLLNEVKLKISGSEILKDRVKLLGKINLEEREPYYSSADYFVLGSHYEGTNYSLSDALSCGCVPIITNIPSFRLMTNDGCLGAIWQPGDMNSFVEAAKFAMNKPLKAEAEACIAFFRKNISFDAIAGIALNYYRQLIDQRSKRR